MYLRTDERSDVLVSLSMCLKCMKSVETEPQIWKWAILTLHNALQGAMVCHLSGSANLGALTKQSAEKWLAWYQTDAPDIPEGNSKPQPQDRLASAGILFMRLYKEQLRPELGAGAVLDITKKQQDSFRRLHSFRNDFTHFTPRGWSIELSGLPGIFLDMLDVIEKISEDPWPFRHMECPEKVKLKNQIAQLRTVLRCRD